VCSFLGLLRTELTTRALKVRNTNTNKMKVKELIEQILKTETLDNFDALVTVEMPDDKSQYAVEGFRYDKASNSVIIEVG